MPAVRDAVPETVFPETTTPVLLFTKIPYDVVPVMVNPVT